MDSEKERKWREEREKVLEEWSEIELRFREGTPVRIAVSRESLDMGDAISLQPTILSGLSEPISWCPEKPPEDPLVERLLSADYSDEKSLIKSSLPLQVSSVNSFMRRCICRPAERLNSEELADERILLLATTKSCALPVQLIKTCLEPYSSATLFHWPMLLSFYRTTASHALEDSSLASECPSIGSHWQIVGFQGTNPLTDFRGVGVFGLLQLYVFVQSVPEDRLKEIVKLSRSEPHDFPLAVVGLNISALLVDRLRGDDLNAIINNHGSVLYVMNRLFRASMERFAAIWKERRCTITDTQTVLNEINGLLRSDAWRMMKSCSS